MYKHQRRRVKKQQQQQKKHQSKASPSAFGCVISSDLHKPNNETCVFVCFFSLSQCFPWLLRETRLHPHLRPRRSRCLKSLQQKEGKHAHLKSTSAQSGVNENITWRQIAWHTRCLTADILSLSLSLSLFPSPDQTHTHTHTHTHKHTLPELKGRKRSLVVCYEWFVSGHVPAARPWKHLWAPHIISTY